MRRTANLTDGSAKYATAENKIEGTSPRWRQQSSMLWGRMREAWHARWQRQCPPCSAPGCLTSPWSWERLRPVWQRVWLENEPYCSPCLAPALHRRFALCHQMAVPAAKASHRIPLGLLMISRGWLTPAQLRTALGRQRRRGGRLGDALCALGYTGEERIAAGLAMQWACPVLTLRSPVAERDLGLVPLRLQELHAAVPVHYSEPSRVLVLAFCGSVDYGLMHAIGGMLDCRVEPCVATETQVRRALSASPDNAREPEISFERIPECSERSSIALSYIQHWGAHTVRVVRCGKAVWARLERPAQKPSLELERLDLLFEAVAGEVAAA